MSLYLSFKKFKMNTSNYFKKTKSKIFKNFNNKSIISIYTSTTNCNSNYADLELKKFTKF